MCVPLGSGGADNDVIVWDVVAEAGMCRLSGHKDQVTGLVVIVVGYNICGKVFCRHYCMTMSLPMHL